MSLRGRFGSNLTRLTEKRGSINHVARQLDIERRQYRRYLSGEVIPHKQTVARIARYFGVSEDMLFGEPDVPALGQMLDPSCMVILESVRAGPPRIEPGLYHTWFWTPEHRDTVIGALTAVRRDADRVTFRRVTASAEGHGTAFSFVKGDHQGIVSERMGWTYFQGSNQIEPKEPTLLVVNWAASSRPILNGHGMVITQAGPTFVNVVMVPVDRDVGLRSALRLTRAFAIEDPVIGLQVAALLKRPVSGWD